MAQEPTHTDRDAAAAQVAMDFVQAGELEKAAIHLHRSLGTRLISYLRRHRVPEADAEELVSEAESFLSSGRGTVVPAVVQGQRGEIQAI